jgi:hypothetical protein
MTKQILVFLAYIIGHLATARVTSAAGVEGGVSQQLRPVTWSAGVAGPKASDLAQALDKPLEQPWTMFDRKTRERHEAGTCKQLLTLDPTSEPMDVHEDGSPPTTLIGNDWNVYTGYLLGCRILVAIQGAKPSRVDYLGGFALENARLKDIPAAVIPTPSPDEEQQLKKASARGVSWKRWDRRIHVTKTDRGTIVVDSPDTHCFLSIEGRGDFDGDGVEDLVLYRSGGGQEGTWNSASAFVLTRRSPRGRVEVVKVIE